MSQILAPVLGTSPARAQDLRLARDLEHRVLSYDTQALILINVNSEPEPNSVSPESSWSAPGISSDDHSQDPSTEKEALKGKKPSSSSASSTSSSSKKGKHDQLENGGNKEKQRMKKEKDKKEKDKKEESSSSSASESSRAPPLIGASALPRPSFPLSLYSSSRLFAALTLIADSGSVPPVTSSTGVPLPHVHESDNAAIQLGVEFQESAIRVEDAREKKKKNIPVKPVDKKHKATLQVRPL